MVSRVERTQYANWWWTVDRLMLAALDRARRRQHPAERIRQAGLRDPDLVAVCRIDTQIRHAGEHARARAFAVRDRRAGAAARLRPDHADRAGMGRAVLHGRDAA